MSDMLQAVLGLPAQLRWAADLQPPQLAPASRLLVCGMGGSGISGDVAGLLAADHGRLGLVHKGYGLPAWAVHERPLVVAVSYSGNTEETVAAVEQAAEAGLDLVSVSSGGTLAESAAAAGRPHLAVPGGLQPRAALGYLAGAVARVAEAAGVAAPQAPALNEAAEVASVRLGAGDGSATALASDLAEALVERVPVVYGGQGLGAVAAQRWKTQINENAKRPAFWAPLPELDHNEVVGWSALARLTRRRFGLVHLRHSGDHPRVALRFDVTAEVTAADVDLVGEVWAEGESTLARLVSLLVVADLVSLELARQEAVDPMPVTAIDILKERLSRETSEE